MLDCRNENCTGCGVCMCSCPKHAIHMVLSEEGFLYPKVEEFLCVKCGLCNKVCPALVKPKGKVMLDGYAAQLKDKSILKNCTSGGAFYGIAQTVLEKNGVVFGVKDMGTDLYYQKVESLEELDELIGSKYYQCFTTEETYHDIVECSHKKITLVSGTPCMMAAIQNLSGLNRKNLFTFEILCQGVPSAQVVKKFYAEKAVKHGAPVKSHIFRSKERYVGRNYLNRYDYEDESVEYLVGEEDPLSLSFQRQIFLRESCYRCQYANVERVADFTAGDLWRINSEKIHLEQGCSIVLCNTMQAKQLFEEAVGLEKEKIDAETALKNNIPYHHPVHRPRCRNWSYKMLNSRLSPTQVTIFCCWKYYLKRLLVGKQK